MSKFRQRTRGVAQDHNIAVALSVQKRTLSLCRITISNIGRDKAFVYDLNIERGIVRMRVCLCATIC
jgi:hypothetical protein